MSDDLVDVTTLLDDEPVGGLLIQVVALCAAVALPRRRSIAIVEVGCLDVCPKGAIVVMRGKAPGRWLLVPKGATLPEVAERLGLASPAETSQRASESRGEPR